MSQHAKVHGPGDLVTYTFVIFWACRDINGIVIRCILQDPDDNIWYATIKWLDGAEYPEMFKTHTIILVKSKK